MSKKHVAPTRAKTGQFAARSSDNGQFRERQSGGAFPPRDNERTYRNSHDGRFIIGSEAMGKLNAVEGIRQSPESRKMFAAFERTGASDEERRRAIVAKHAKKG